MQQSAVESDQAESKSLQLSIPHTKSPAQWASSSQSPSPLAQGDEAVQQLQLSLEINQLASQPEVTDSQNVFFFNLNLCTKPAVV